MTPPTPTRHRAIWVLRGHLLLAGLLIVGGCALSLLGHGALPEATLPLTGLVAGLAWNDGTAWVSLGFVLLILTPVVRLLVTAGRFVRERDPAMFGVALLVLGIVFSGLVIGRH